MLHLGSGAARAAHVIAGTALSIGGCRLARPTGPVVIEITIRLRLEQPGVEITEVT